MSGDRSASKLLYFSFSTLMLAALVACGGGGGAGSNSAQLSGVAAYGAPMQGASITLTDANGQSRTTNTSTDGSYTLDVTGLTAPFLLKASSAAGDSVKEYVALVTSAPTEGKTVVANVTPLTHALVTMVSSDGASPNEFTDSSKLKTLDTSKLSAALVNLQAALKNVLVETGLSEKFDPLSVRFKADRTNAEDTLLDTIKVSVSDQGVTLHNARVSVNDNGISNTEAATVTLKGTSNTLRPLPRSTVQADDLKGLDAFVAQANACLALAPSDRVSKGTGTAAGAFSNTYTFQGACAEVTSFDKDSYKTNGYPLTQTWGPRLLSQIPANSKLLPPEFLLFESTRDHQTKARVKLSSTSPTGGRTFVEHAVKTDAGWKIVGNQLNYDAGVSALFYRHKDLSTHGRTIPLSDTPDPDAGKNIGKLDVFSSALSFTFNPTGPNGHDVFAVRVKGPGLPRNGIVLARSSTCGTDKFLAFYSNNGELPNANSKLQTRSTSKTWVLDASTFGNAYKGSDFYKQWRGSRINISEQPVKMDEIPEFATYSWEVFTLSGGSTVAAAKFTTRNVTRPLAASEGQKLPWAVLNQDALDYLDPTHISKSDSLSSVSFGWTLPTASTPEVTSAGIYGRNNTDAVGMGLGIGNRGDTSVKLSLNTQYNGAGVACSYAKVPSFTATMEYREVSVQQKTDHGLILQNLSYHEGRSPN